MDTTENMTGGAAYSKDTYIGYLKLKNGGMKVIPGDMDNQIIQKRNNILLKLEILLSVGYKLKEKNIEKYFKALGGNYIRNDMCISGNTSACKKGKQASIGGANKLMELASSKYTPELLTTKFKGSAPVLYQKYKKINNNGYENSRIAPEYASQGGYDREYDYNRDGGYDREYDGGYDDMYGGNKDAINPALEELRMDIERYKYFSGGNSNNELELLRDEINKIRNI
jgi:hypothetical protein